jgi:hypothetical protein
MAESAQEIAGNSIVLLGSFEAASAQPKALLEKGLIRETDLTDLRVDMMLPPDVIALSFPWISFVVERERIVASTTFTSPLAEPVRDFVLDLVEHMTAPRVNALGFNTDYHFATANVGVWHKIGHTLVPKDVLWDKVMKSPGTMSLSLQGQRDDGLSGYVSVRVEPSLRIPNGLYVQVNDHFNGPSASAAEKKFLLETLDERWTECIDRATRIISAVKDLHAQIARGAIS